MNKIHHIAEITRLQVSIFGFSAIIYSRTCLMFNIKINHIRLLNLHVVNLYIKKYAKKARSERVYY